MPIVSVSLITALKGALFLSKSAAAKALLVKASSLIAGGASVASVVSSGLVVCTVAGYCVTIKNMPKKTADGYIKITNGIANGCFSDFIDGLYQLGRAGMSASSIMNSFIDFVDGMEAPSDIKISLKSTMKSLEYQVLDTVENKTYKLMKEVEASLKCSGYTEDKYVSEVKTIYFKHTYDLNDDYEELKGRAGRIYSDICELNDKCGIRTYGEYDHYLVFCIAGWFIENKPNLCCLRGKSQKQVANDITEQIFKYLKAYNKD